MTSQTTVTPATGMTPGPQPEPARVTILDGGTGQELLARADNDPTPLWSAQVMIDQPDLVRDVHAAYLRAGADVITLNAYSATPCRLGPNGLGDRFVDLQHAAGELAQAARRQAERPEARIAGCLSPYGWSYRSDLAPPYSDLVPHYTAIAALQNPYVDLFLCETMSSIEEGRAAVDAARPFGKPVWLSFTVDDTDGTRLRSGELLSDAIDAVAVDAVLVNCSPPEVVDQSIKVLATGSGPFGAYANGFTHIDDGYAPGSVTSLLGCRHDLTPDAYADRAMAWVGQGATIVGGCCEIGPDHIATLVSRLNESRR